jgi:hypothetical protein
MINTTIYLFANILMGTTMLFLINPFLNMPSYFYFILSFPLTYITYKSRFKNKNTFKYFLFKNYIQLRNSYKNLNNKLNHKNLENDTLLPIQLKGMRLWKLCLRDNDSIISCSMINRTRQIEKNNMLLILSPINELDYQITIMDVDVNKSCLYEIRAIGKHAESLIEMFDDENERRMNLGQVEKRNSIHNDLDKLLSQQESSLKSRKK